MDFVLRLEPKYQPTWADVDYIYSPINYSQHWLMLANDITKVEYYCMTCIRPTSHYIILVSS